MNIIIVGRGHGQSKTIRLGFISRIFLLLFFFVVPVSIGYGAYYFSQEERVDPVFDHQSVKAWVKELQNQKQSLDELRDLSKEEVNALTVRMAELQSRLTRLDAVGERLTDVANLDHGEFDFSVAPAVGGPGTSDLGESYRVPSFNEAMEELSDRIEDREQQLEVLETLLDNRQIEKDVFVAGRPIKRGWMSSRYGRRNDPFTGRLSWHAGVDFAGKTGSDIIAVAAGVVVWSGNRGGYGIMVEVNHGNGFTTRYAHCKTSEVKMGDIVRKGQVIAKMGSSGRSTGPHVHFEVWKDNRAVDPAAYIHRAGL